MNGTTPTGAAGYIANGVPTNWRIVGIADLNGDGWPDIL